MSWDRLSRLACRTFVQRLFFCIFRMNDLERGEGRGVELLPPPGNSLLAISRTMGLKPSRFSRNASSRLSASITLTTGSAWLSMICRRILVPWYSLARLTPENSLSLSRLTMAPLLAVYCIFSRAVIVSAIRGPSRAVRVNWKDPALPKSRPK